MLMSLISPTGFWGETMKVSSNYSCLTGILETANCFVKYWCVNLNRTHPDPKDQMLKFCQQNRVSTKSWLLYNCGETSVCKLWHRSHLDTSWQWCLHIGSWQSSVSIVHCEWTSLRPRWQNSDMCHFKYRVYNHRLCLKSQTHSLFTTDYTGYWLQ